MPGCFDLINFAMLFSLLGSLPVMTLEKIAQLLSYFTRGIKGISGGDESSKSFNIKLLEENMGALESCNNRFVE